MFTLLRKLVVICWSSHLPQEDIMSASNTDVHSKVLSFVFRHSKRHCRLRGAETQTFKNFEHPLLKLLKIMHTVLVGNVDQVTCEGAGPSTAFLTTSA